MLLKFLCCDVLTRIACDLVAKSPHIVDLEFVPMLIHAEPGRLKGILEEKIEQTFAESEDPFARRYDALILGFGLCGNATIGLKCPVPMVIPRAHDCCTLFMGGKEQFLASFGKQLSTRWCCTGYYERTFGAWPDDAMALSSVYPSIDQLDNYKTSAEYMGFVEQYDEETAEYLWQSMHPNMETDESIYIKIDGMEFSDSLAEYSKLMARMDVALTTVEGSNALLRALVNGDWDEERFLIVPPGKEIAGVYDFDEVMRAV